MPSSEALRSTEWYFEICDPIQGLQPAPWFVEVEILEEIWLQVMDAASDEAPGDVLRIGVQDRDPECTVLRPRVVDVGSTIETPVSEGGRVIALRYLDGPDGNKICVYQVRTSSCSGGLGGATFR